MTVIILACQNGTFDGKHGLFEGVGSLGVYMLAAGQGFEPRYHPPGGCVLPLDDPAMTVEFYHKMRLN